MLYGSLGVEVVGDCRCESDGVERGGERGKCCRVFDGFSFDCDAEEENKESFCWCCLLVLFVGVLVDSFLWYWGYRFL